MTRDPSNGVSNDIDNVILTDAFVLRSSDPPTDPKVFGALNWIISKSKSEESVSNLTRYNLKFAVQHKNWFESHPFRATLIGPFVLCVHDISPRKMIAAVKDETKSHKTTTNERNIRSRSVFAATAQRAMAEYGIRLLMPYGATKWNPFLFSFPSSHLFGFIFIFYSFSMAFSWKLSSTCNIM